jgi:hypothetical protein
MVVFLTTFVWEKEAWLGGNGLHYDAAGEKGIMGAEHNVTLGTK